MNLCLKKYSGVKKSQKRVRFLLLFGNKRSTVLLQEEDGRAWFYGVCKSIVLTRNLHPKLRSFVRSSQHACISQGHEPTKREKASKVRFRAFYNMALFIVGLPILKVVLGST